MKEPQKSYEETELTRIEQVNIDEKDPLRCAGVGAELQKSMKAELIAFLKENSSTFAWSIEDMTVIDPSITTHELNADPSYKPVKQKRRELGPERARAVNDEVSRLLKVGLIVEVQYSEWLANPVVVKKKNGKWRVCVDFTDLNKACPKQSYPLPHIDRLVESTTGNELMSFIDAFSGYNQILMHHYIDDMLVKSLKATDHIQHLQQCFDVLNKYNMKLNPAKCTFGVTSGEFLGYIVTQRDIEANLKQIRAILELPSSRNAREVQRFIGRIAALNRFIARSTDKCLPFYNLLKRKAKFDSDDASEQAFNNIKTYLTTPSVLTKPEVREILFLYIAVSDFAVSRVLVRDDRGEQLPIFYISKSLIEAETRYPTIEKAAFTVVTSGRKLRPYFQSHTIAVLTDQPLRVALHSPSQSGRMTKWFVELSEYEHRVP